MKRWAVSSVWSEKRPGVGGSGIAFAIINNLTIFGANSEEEAIGAGMKEAQEENSSRTFISIQAMEIPDA